MSRSIHKTIKGVFGNKSAREIEHMIEEDDPDVEELRRKFSYKKAERDKRKLHKETKTTDIQQ